MKPKRLAAAFIFPMLLAFNACNNDVPNDDNKGNETFLHSEKNASIYDTGAYTYPDDKLFIVLNLDGDKQHSASDKHTSDILNTQGASIRKFLETNGYKEYNPSSKGTWVFKNKAGEQKVDPDSLDNEWGVLIYTENDSVFVYRGNAPETDLKNVIK